MLFLETNVKHMIKVRMYMNSNVRFLIKVVKHQKKFLPFAIKNKRFMVSCVPFTILFLLFATTKVGFIDHKLPPDISLAFPYVKKMKPLVPLIGTKGFPPVQQVLCVAPGKKLLPYRWSGSVFRDA